MFSTDVAFTPTVKTVQQELGSRHGYAKLEARGGWPQAITPEVAEFISNRDSFYLGTANKIGQPYIQHRGGPRGFFKILSPTQIGFADFRGNRQYITVGNLRDNAQVFLFLMDYEAKARVKIWGRAQATDSPELLARLAVPTYEATIERGIVIDVVAWDANCRAHIPTLASDATLGVLRRQLVELERENQRLRALLPATTERGPT